MPTDRLMLLSLLFLFEKVMEIMTIIQDLQGSVDSLVARVEVDEAKIAAGVPSDPNVTHLSVVDEAALVAMKAQIDKVVSAPLPVSGSAGATGGAVTA